MGSKVVDHANALAFLTVMNVLSDAAAVTESSNRAVIRTSAVLFALMSRGEKMYHNTTEEQAKEMRGGRKHKTPQATQRVTAAPVPPAGSGSDDDEDESPETVG